MFLRFQAGIKFSVGPSLESKLWDKSQVGGDLNRKVFQKQNLCFKIN